MAVAQHVALALRKQRLLDRIATQREQLAAGIEPLRRPLALADTLVQVGRGVKQQPWIAGAAVFVLVVLRRRNLFRWVGRGWALWRGWRVAQRWLHDNGFL